MKRTKVGIIGIGMVGKRVKKWFLKTGYKLGVDLFCYDKKPAKKCFDKKGAREKANVLFVCVNTPSKKDGSCDISFIESVIKSLPSKKDRVIVVKSTVLPGTVAAFAQKYKRKGYFLFNPEFLTESRAWEDFKNPVLQIVAAADNKAKKWTGPVLDLLPCAPFTFGVHVVDTYDFYAPDSTQAELAKYAINQYGALIVTFWNTVYERCKLLGVDFWPVWKMVTSDPRIGSSWSNPLHGGVRGYNGFCFPKDTDAILEYDKKKIEEARQKGISARDAVVYQRLIEFFSGMKYFNADLHWAQGTTVEEMSVHDKAREKRIKEKEWRTESGDKK